MREDTMPRRGINFGVDSIPLFLMPHPPEQCVEEFEVGGGDLVVVGAAEGFAQDGVYLEGAVGLVVEEHGGLVAADSLGDVDEFLKEFLREDGAIGGGDGGDLAHDGGNEGADPWVVEKRPCVGMVGEDAQGVEGDVPRQLLPADGDEGVIHDAFHGGAVEHCGDGMGAFAGGTAVFGKVDPPLVNVVNVGGSDAIAAKEGDAPENAVRSPATVEVAE